MLEMSKITKIFTAAFIGLCSPFFIAESSAQSPEEVDAFISYVRESIKKDRIVILSESLRLTPAEAASFWGIYEKFSKEMGEIEEARIDLIKDYFFDILLENTAETAHELTLRAFAITEGRLKIRRKYYPLFAQGTSDSTATRFMQIDRMIDSALDLKIAQMMPAFPTKLSEFLENEDSDGSNF